MDAEMEAHVRKLKKMEGKRYGFFDTLKMSLGWVVTTKVPEGFWDKCKVTVIPVEAVRLVGLFPSAATFEMMFCTSKYGKDIMMVIIPDTETDEGLSGGPILLKDLDRDPEVLLDESVECASRDSVLSEAKKRCAMLLGGWSDTK